MKITPLILLIIILSFFSCEKAKTINGLWVVKSVGVGDEIMTPNGRWMRFNSDFTQQSGNGWLQHSVGTWNFNKNSMELSIKNTNGLIDENEPFKISFEEKKMIWKRMEEGQNIKVILERSSELPQTYGDKLFGLWELERAFGSDNYFKDSDKKEMSNYIFFRWDKRFVIESEKGKINGVYNVHGHKSEVELIPYSDQVNRNFWKIDFEENRITLKLLNSEKIITREFKRMQQFPK